MEKFTQRHNRREQVRRIDMKQDDCGKENCASTQFLQIQKNQLIEQQEQSERYCNVLAVFAFKSANYVLNLVKSFLLPIFSNEQDNEPTVIKKSNQCISFIFGDFQLLDILKVLGGATSLDSFVKS